MFDVRLGITNFVFCGYIRAYYTCFNQRQASIVMNHAKTSSYKLITIPFIFTKDLKKKIEEIMNAIPIECILHSRAIENRDMCL